MNAQPVDAYVFGFVMPPDDYGPAISVLSLEARAKMDAHLAAGLPQDRSIALAADWDNEQLRSRRA